MIFSYFFNSIQIFVELSLAVHCTESSQSDGLLEISHSSLQCTVLEITGEPFYVLLSCILSESKYAEIPTLLVKFLAEQGRALKSQKPAKQWNMNKPKKKAPIRGIPLTAANAGLPKADPDYDLPTFGTEVSSAFMVLAHVKTSFNGN
jgi:hypothetical protein